MKHNYDHTCTTSYRFCETLCLLWQIILCMLCFSFISCSQHLVMIVSLELATLGVILEMGQFTCLGFRRTHHQQITRMIPMMGSIPRTICIQTQRTMMISTSTPRLGHLKKLLVSLPEEQSTPPSKLMNL